MKLYVAAVALVGCAQSSPVTGHISYHYLDGTTVPADLSQVQYQVLVENGDGYDPYPDQPVLGTADGTFEIDGVPDGVYWLESKSTGSGSNPMYVRRSERDINFTDTILGRPDDVPVSAATPLMIDATNLTMWGATDQLYIDCFENATEASTPTFTPALAAGAQQIQGSFDWADTMHVYSFGLSRQPSLMRAGDHVTVSHQTDVQTTPIEVSVLSQVMTTDAPAQINGQTATISGAFADVPRTEQMSITVDPARFEATPGAYTNWSVTAVAGLGTAQRYGIGPELFGMGQIMPTTAATTSVMYGNPFDPSWTPLLTAHFEEGWDIDGFTQYVDLAYEDRPLGAGDFTFEPLAPIKNLTIGGNAVGNTFQVPTGLPLPLDGQAPDGTSEISVTVWHVTNAFPSVVGYVVADRMPIDLPADLFQSGERYTFAVIAEAFDSDRFRSSTATTAVMTYIAQ